MADFLPDEIDHLERCEAIIERGLQTFMLVGTALMEIRDSRLYRHFGTFEDYCRERWGLNRQRAYQLIDAARVVQNVNHGGQAPPILPTNERQVRPIVNLEPDQQRTVWQKAVETAPGGHVTGRHVEAIVRDVVCMAPKPDGVHREPGDDDPDRCCPDSSSDPGPVHVSEALDAWLEILPLRSQLTGQALEIFNSDSELFFAARGRVRQFMDDIKGLLKAHDRRGAYHASLRGMGRLRKPQTWVCCPSEEFGGCGGTGLNRGRTCPACRGRGYRMQPCASKKQMALLKDMGFEDPAILNPAEASAAIEDGIRRDRMSR